MGPRQRQGHSRSKTHAFPVILLSILGFLLVANTIALSYFYNTAGKDSVAEKIATPSVPALDANATPSAPVAPQAPQSAPNAGENLAPQAPQGVNSAPNSAPQDEQNSTQK